MNNNTQTAWQDDFEKDLDAWLESFDHAHECASHNEGLYCCLDKVVGTPIYGGKGRDFIIKLISTIIEKERNEAFEKGYEIGKTEAGERY